jgi:8-oxo-dGTP diphosphatase
MLTLIGLAPTACSIILEGHLRSLGARPSPPRCFATSHHSGQSVRVFESVPVRVVAAILRRENRLLLCHRHPERAWYPDVWNLPGGHVEPGETPTEALARELREELAVDLQSPLGLPFEEVADSAAAFNMTIWLIDYAGAVVNHAPDEHDELRWVTSDEIAGLVLAHPSYVELLGRAAHT